MLACMLANCLRLPCVHFVLVMLQDYQGAVVAVAVAGVVTGLLAAIVAGLTNCKQISDSIVAGRSYLQFKDHSEKVGYQHSVRVCVQTSYATSSTCHIAAMLQYSSDTAYRTTHSTSYATSKQRPLSTLCRTKQHTAANSL